MSMPHVIEGVREELSRRGFLASVAIVAAAMPAAAQQKPLRCPRDSARSSI
jgi:hypothetical protein